MNERLRRTGYIVPFLFLTLSPPIYSQPSIAPWQDPSPHTVRFVEVEKDIRLEVLDWGGSGRPIVLLAGGGDTAHVFDEFAPKLATDHRVYGITRRGFGYSGFSIAEHPLDRLRDDVLAVVSALNLTRPVLVGHSIAGAELSAVATLRPDQVAGLVFIEAAYPYAFDNGSGPRMTEFQTSAPRQPSPTEADLASFSALQRWDAGVFGFRRPEAELHQVWEADPSGRPQKARDFPGSQLFMAILSSPKAVANIPAPALAMFALPHTPESWIDRSENPQVQEAARTYYAAIDAATARQAKAFESGVPAARVVRLRGAHYMFLSNAEDTLREMRAFLGGLNSRVCEARTRAS